MTMTLKVPVLLSKSGHFKVHRLTVAAHNGYISPRACMHDFGAEFSTLIYGQFLQEPQFICKCHEFVWCINTWQWLLRFSKTWSHRLLVSSYKWISTVLITLYKLWGWRYLLLKFHQVTHATFQRRIWFIQSDDTTMDPGEVKRLCLLADGWCGIWAKTHSTHFE